MFGQVEAIGTCRDRQYRTRQDKTAQERSVTTITTRKQPQNNWGLVLWLKDKSDFQSEVTLNKICSPLENMGK